MPTVDEISQTMVELVADALKLPPQSIALEVYFDDLGLDSLMVVGIVGDLEDRLGVELNMDLLWDNQSIRDLSRAVHDSLVEHSS